MNYRSVAFVPAVVGVEIIARVSYVALATAYAVSTTSTLSNTFLAKFFLSHVGGVIPVGLSLSGDADPVYLAVSYLIGLGVVGLVVRAPFNRQ